MESRQVESQGDYPRQRIQNEGCCQFRRKNQLSGQKYEIAIEKGASSADPEPAGRGTEKS